VGEKKDLRRINPREARRMMQRMGMNMNPLEVQEVILKTKSKDLLIKNPEVTVLEVQGQKIFQIIGGEIIEKTLKSELLISEEDIQLVAQQAKVNLEQAKVALEQTNGDLAQAILLLNQR
jgi:nascent polypeptide-associated complex subunit alpha